MIIALLAIVAIIWIVFFFDKGERGPYIKNEHNKPVIEIKKEEPVKKKQVKKELIKQVKITPALCERGDLHYNPQDIRCVLCDHSETCKKYLKRMQS